MKEKKYKFYKKIKIKNRNRKLYVKRNSKSRKLYIKHHKKMVEYKKYIKKQQGGLWNPFKSKTPEEKRRELHEKRKKLEIKITELNTKLINETDRYQKILLIDSIKRENENLQKIDTELQEIDPKYKEDRKYSDVLRKSQLASNEYSKTMQNRSATPKEKLDALQLRQDTISRENVYKDKMNETEPQMTYSAKVQKEYEERTLREGYHNYPTYRLGTSGPPRVTGDRPPPPSKLDQAQIKVDREKERRKEEREKKREIERETKNKYYENMINPEKYIYDEIKNLIKEYKYIPILDNFEKYKDIIKFPRQIYSKVL